MGGTVFSSSQHSYLGQENKNFLFVPSRSLIGQGMEESSVIPLAAGDFSVGRTGGERPSQALLALESFTVLS